MSEYESHHMEEHVSRHTGRRQSGTRDRISLIFSFFLALFLSVVAVLFVVRVGILSERAFVSVVDDEYCTYAFDNLQAEARYYTLPSGIDTSVLEGVFNVADLRRDARGYITAAFNGVEYQPDTTETEARLSANVANFLTNDGMEDGEEKSAIVTGFTQGIMEVYRSAAKIPGLDAVAKLHERYERIALLALVVNLVLAIVIVVLIMRMHHYPHRALRFVAYATGGAFLVCFIVPFILLMSKFYLGINLQPQFFYYFGVSLIKNVLKLCVFTSLIYLVITIILIIVIAKMRENAMKRHKLHG